MYAWDVTQSLYDHKGKRREDILWDKVDNWECKVFNWAHEADSDAFLLYNDFEHGMMTERTKAKSDAVYNHMKELIGKGCHIHGVGLMLNSLKSSTSDEDLNTIRDNLQRYAKLPLFVHITDVQVRCDFVEHAIGKCVE